jgi:hypothetical protein
MIVGKRQDGPGVGVAGVDCRLKNAHGAACPFAQTDTYRRFVQRVVRLKHHGAGETEQSFHSARSNSKTAKYAPSCLRNETAVFTAAVNVGWSKVADKESNRQSAAITKMHPRVVARNAVMSLRLSTAMRDASFVQPDVRRKIRIAYRRVSAELDCAARKQLPLIRFLFLIGTGGGANCVERRQTRESGEQQTP